MTSRASTTDLETLLQAAAQTAGSTIERKTDQYGFEWVIVRDPDFEDVVTSVHTVASELTAQGFGAQLLAAAFRFEGSGNPVYWIYGFKLGEILAVHPEWRKSARQCDRAGAKG